VANIVDALRIAQCYVGIIQCAAVNVADVNCDGSITIIDALMVAQYYVGLLTNLNCCGTSPTATPLPDYYLSCYLEFNPAIYPTSRHYPQYSLWVKDKATGKIFSVFITRFSAGLSESSDNYRPYALPVWFGVRKKEKTQNPYPALDAISGATPLVANTTLSWHLPKELINKDIEVYLEGNISFDFNDYYTFDPNGQPSLIWMSEMNTNRKIVSIEPPVIGHGTLMGEDALIHTEGLPNITDAKDIFKRVVFKF